MQHGAWNEESLVEKTETVLYTPCMLDVKQETPQNHLETASEEAQPPRADSFYLAHLSDLHLTSLLDIKFSELFNKRILGYLSWRRKRRAVHRLDIVESLMKDLDEVCPDHVAITGDLTHIGLPREFAEAAHWLSRLGPPEQVTVIPGNHEAYAGRKWFENLSLWTPYLLSESKPVSPQAGSFFPTLSLRGQIALIGLCSARPSLPFLAVGSLGETQLGALAKLLEKSGEAGYIRVILVHHPPVSGTMEWRKRMVDTEAFSEVVSRYGAELVLHGHTHSPTFRELQTPAGKIPVIGAPSGSELNPHAARCAKYNLYRIRRNDVNWELTMFVRGYSEKSGTFVEEQEIALNIPFIQPGERQQMGS